MYSLCVIRICNIVVEKKKCKKNPYSLVNNEINILNSKKVMKLSVTGEGA